MSPCQPRGLWNLPNLSPFISDAFIIYHIHNCDVCELFLIDYKQCQKHIQPNYMT